METSFYINGVEQKPTSRTNGSAAPSRKSVTEKQTATKDKYGQYLDYVFIMFLLYSGAHNVINALTRVDGNILFFIFVMVGIVSVELMLWAVHNMWKTGELTGSQRTVALWGGLFAFAFATAGILSQAGGFGEAIMYYQFVLPASAPVMFVFAFAIQAKNPVLRAELDALALARMVDVENTRETLAARQDVIAERRSSRQLASRIIQDKIFALWREADTRRARKLLSISAQYELPKRLKDAGVNIQNKSNVTLAGRKYKQLTGGVAKAGAPSTNGKTSLT